MSGFTKPPATDGAGSAFPPYYTVDFSIEFEIDRQDSPVSSEKSELQARQQDSLAAILERI